MSLLSRLNPFSRKQEEPRKPLSETLQAGGIPIPTPPRRATHKEILAEARREVITVPEGVDFSALWDEPSDSSIMPMVLSGIAAVCAAVLLVMHFFGK